MVNDFRGAERTGGSIRIQAPPGYDVFASWVKTNGLDRIRSMEEWAGVSLRRPIVVQLYPPEGGRMPEWAAGWESGGVITIRVRTMARFPATFAHEAAHAVTNRMIGRGDVPLWFREGVAMLMAGEEGSFWERLLISMGDEPTLASLRRSFPRSQRGSREAYALSLLAVREIMNRCGRDGLIDIMRQAGQGRPFENALIGVAGLSTTGLDDDIRGSLRLRHIYLPFFTSAGFLWLALTGLFVVVYIRKRKRAEEILATWEEEESHDPDVPCH